MRTGEAHNSYYLKGPHEDQIRGYDALTLVNAYTSVCLIFVCGCVEQVTTIPVLRKLSLVLS